MNKTIVITCFNGNKENIIEKTKNKFNIVLYNKKNNDFGLPIKNIGVDAYDKLHYIVNNYDNLTNIVLFTTDSMYNMGPKKSRKIDYILENINKLENNSGFLTEHIYKMKTEIEYNFTIDIYKNKKLNKSPDRPFYNWFKKYINNDLNADNIFYCKKSCFAVSKDLILNNPKIYYIKLLNYIERNCIHGEFDEIPHYFERAWVEIFTKNNIKNIYYNTKKYGELI